MHDETVTIIENKKINEKYFKLTFQSARLSEKVNPGQFFHLQINLSQDPFLRRPFSYYRVTGNRIEMLYEIESVFDIQIPDEDFSGLVTIGNVIAYIGKKKQPASTRKLTKPSPSSAKPKAASGPSKPTPPARKGR